MDVLMDSRCWVLAGMAVLILVGWFLTGRVLPWLVLCGAFGVVVVVPAFYGDALNEAMKRCAF